MPAFPPKPNSAKKPTVPEEEEVDPDDPLPTDPVDYQGIEPRLFELINFDAPGLEAAKAQIEQKDMVGATQALIDYFKTRDIVNPGIDLADKYISASGKSIADQALQHRFYTISYDQGTGEDGQRAFFDNNDANGQIDWVNAPAGVSDKTEYIKQIHRPTRHRPTTPPVTSAMYKASWKCMTAIWKSIPFPPEKEAERPGPVFRFP